MTWPTMKCRYMPLGAILCVALLCCSSRTACAQGLIWSLPEEDNVSVRYQGTYRQIEERPDSAAGALTVQWDRQLWIKSVGREMAEFRGQMQPCRWIEIKVVTGKPTEEGTDPGLVGARIYKALVPESLITGKSIDDETIPVSLIPIVRGYRRFGEGEVTPIDSSVLQVYPLITLFRHFETLQRDPVEQDPGVKLGPLNAVHYTGSETIESPTTRSQITCELWQSDSVPFGLAKWTCKIVREAKDITDPRTDFQVASTVEVEMSVQEVESDAASEILVPQQ